MKKFIALFLTLLMILTSVNISYAATAKTDPVECQLITLKSSVVLNNQVYTDNYSVGNPMVGFINFDLSKYLPKLYLADSVNLTVTSATGGDASNNGFSLEIIPDNKEQYTNGGYYYNDVVDAGVLSDGVEIYSAGRIGGYGASHPSDDFKAKLIEALESGNNNKLSIRLVLADKKSELTTIGISDPKLVIEYDDAVTDTAYYEEILKSFNLEEKANIDLDNITSDFTLPTFFKGSNITWTSDNANVIAISSDGIASVTKPSDNDEEVTLTATLSYMDGSYYPITYEANVVKKSELEKIADKFNSTYKVSDEDYSAITKDLKLDKTFEGATLSWVSSNEDVIKAETGRVIRSKTEDVQVTLTPTISYNGESKTLNSINVTIKKITVTPATITGQPGTIKKYEVTDHEIFTADGTLIGFINFDFTEYLPKLYLANSAKLTVVSNCRPTGKLNEFSLEIIPDSKEIYTDFNNDNYSAAVAGGILSDGTEILPARVINYSDSHSTNDIRDALIKVLESGNNNKLSIRLVLAEVHDTASQVSIMPNPELTIEYDNTVATDKAYYEKISKDFDLESIANIDLASVKSDFTLPTFFKGSNITWTSGNANVIAISSDGTASVTRAASGNEAVTLTATFSYKDGSSYEISFEAIVPEINVPVIEEVKNNDGSFSAIIKSNEAVNENYTFYFASYTTDNTLVGLYFCPVNGLKEGRTQVDAKEFLTYGATKIKCILLKGNTLTPACKNGEVPNN